MYFFTSESGRNPQALKRGAQSPDLSQLVAMSLGACIDSFRFIKLI